MLGETTIVCSCEELKSTHTKSVNTRPYCATLAYWRLVNMLYKCNFFI